jgi:hypothetical protein
MRRAFSAGNACLASSLGFAQGWYEPGLRPADKQTADPEIHVQGYVAGSVQKTQPIPANSRSLIERYWVTQKGSVA